MASHQSDDTGKNGEVIRLDKILWFLRFASNRSVAKKLATKGHMRLNGRRIDKAHSPVRAGDILTIPMGRPLGRNVKVIRIIHLPVRRAGAALAMSCYEILVKGT